MHTNLPQLILNRLNFKTTLLLSEFIVQSSCHTLETQLNLKLFARSNLRKHIKFQAQLSGEKKISS